MSQSSRQRFPFAAPLCMVLRVGWNIRTTRWRSSPRGLIKMRYSASYWRGAAVPGAPLTTSALRTSFGGIGAISDGSLLAVEAGGLASVERVRSANEERKRVGLAKASEQARRRDIDLVTVQRRAKKVLVSPTAEHLILAYISHGRSLVNLFGASRPPLTHAWLILRFAVRRPSMVKTLR
jgi:hypothetical protein